jgi:hypothetical protein
VRQLELLVTVDKLCLPVEGHPAAILVQSFSAQDLSLEEDQVVRSRYQLEVEQTE